MGRASSFSFLILTTILFSAIADDDASNLNLTPVIGILQLPSDYNEFPTNNWNYMAASYVKYIESAGARVVPINWDQSPESLTTIMRALNGILLTGGSADFVMPDNTTLTPFGKAVETIVNNVIKFNNEGTHYPLWGTCLGFQALSCIIAGQSSGNYNCLYTQSDFVSTRSNMSFFEDAPSHPVFAQLTSDLKQSFLQEGIIFFNMHYTVQRNLWEENAGLKSNFTQLSYVTDSAGTNFSVLVAGTKYPIYGSQFHPEKNQFEWNDHQDIPHSYQAILGSQMYANFFVDETRKNFNSFNGSGIDFDSVSIYNWNPIQLPNASFDQIYFFKRAKSGSPYFIETEDIDAQMALEFLL